jgi:hypothetical protein
MANQTTANSIVQSMDYDDDIASARHLCFWRHITTPFAMPRPKPNHLERNTHASNCACLRCDPLRQRQNDDGDASASSDDEPGAVPRAILAAEAAQAMRERDDIIHRASRIDAPTLVRYWGRFLSHRDVRGGNKLTPYWRQSNGVRDSGQGTMIRGDSNHDTDAKRRLKSPPPGADSTITPGVGTCAPDERRATEDE